MDLTALGASGIFIIMVLRMVLEATGKAPGKDSKRSARDAEVLQILGQLAHTADSQARMMTKMASQMSDLHRWHAPNDQGRQAWKWDLEKPIEDLARAIADLSGKIDRAA